MEINKLVTACVHLLWQPVNMCPVVKNMTFSLMEPVCHTAHVSQHNQTGMQMHIFMLWLAKVHPGYKSATIFNQAVFPPWHFGSTLFLALLHHNKLSISFTCDWTCWKSKQAFVGKASSFVPLVRQLSHKTRCCYRNSVMGVEDVQLLEQRSKNCNQACLKEG